MQPADVEGAPGAPPPGFGAGQRVVLFDGVCRICSAWVAFLIRRDPGRRLLLCPLQSPEGQAILRHLGRPLDDLDTMIFVEDGVAYFRSSAFLRIVRHLPLPWPLLRVGIIVPRPVRDFLYDRVARNRFRLFGRRESCLLPTPEIEDHFLGNSGKRR